MKDSAIRSEQFIRFSCKKLLLLFVPLAILVILSVLVNPEDWRKDTWATWVLGGVALLIVLACVVMPRRYYLHLTPEGLSIQYVTSRRHYSWKEVRNFRVADGPTANDLPTGRLVVFDLTENSPHRGIVSRASAKISGYDVSILATFSIGAEELAGLLNEWQQRYGQQSA